MHTHSLIHTEGIHTQTYYSVYTHLTRVVLTFAGILLCPLAIVLADSVDQTMLNCPHTEIHIL